MNVTHDLIAAVTGPGWKFGLSRILINDEDEGVVFVAGSEEPYAAFAVQNVTTGRGTGVSEEGPITWRRRGSSCQYKLAKCKVSTETMTQWWDASLAAAPDPCFHFRTGVPESPRSWASRLASPQTWRGH